MRRFRIRTTDSSAFLSSRKGNHCTSLLISASESEQFIIHGESLNFLAQGHRILHPTLSRRPNVLFVDIEIERRFFPSSYHRYIPNASFDPCKNIPLLGVVTSQELSDDSELFADFMDLFVVDKRKIPDWLTETLPEENLLLMKKDHERKLPFITSLIKSSSIPTSVIEKIEIEPRLQARMNDPVPRRLDGSPQPIELKQRDPVDQSQTELEVPKNRSKLDA